MNAWLSSIDSRCSYSVSQVWAFMFVVHIWNCHGQNCTGRAIFRLGIDTLIANILVVVSDSWSGLFTSRVIFTSTITSVRCKLPWCRWPADAHRLKLRSHRIRRRNATQRKTTRHAARRRATLPLKVVTQRNFVADFFREKLNFTGTNSDISFLCHRLGDLGVTYTFHLWLVGKRVVDFL